MCFAPERMAYNGTIRLQCLRRNFFLNFPIYLQSVTLHSDTFSKWCVGKRGRVEECSVAPLRNKRVETLCGCREKGVQTKEQYKLRFTTKAYKLRLCRIDRLLHCLGYTATVWYSSSWTQFGDRRFHPLLEDKDNGIRA
jgi:hypothetical protein